MPDHLDLVKEYLRLNRRWHKTAVDAGEDKKAEVYAKRITGLEGAVAELEELRRVTKPIPASYGDLSDLPPELIKELSGIKVDDLEQQLFTIIQSGNEVDLDTILIELFRRFEVVQTRKFLQNKLWRMCQKEVIYSVPSRKGVYSVNKPNDEFAELADSPPKLPEGMEPNIPPKGGWDDDLDSDIPF